MASSFDGRADSMSASDASKRASGKIAPKDFAFSAAIQ